MNHDGGESAVDRLRQQAHEDDDVTSEMIELIERHQHHNQEDDANAAMHGETASPSLLTPSPQQHHVTVLGFDLSHLPATRQFTICVIGAFSFQLAYGYLQELVTVSISGRSHAVFLAACQFLGFWFWSVVLVQLGRRRNGEPPSLQKQEHHEHEQLVGSSQPTTEIDVTITAAAPAATRSTWSLQYQFAGLALMRAIDVTASNTAMQYLNYPARTILMSSRVVFTMILGVLIQNKRYLVKEYVAVSTLVVGLVFFLHADSRSSAVFHPFGVLLVTVSLTTEGIISNMSEKIMKDEGITQDQYHVRLYVYSFVIAAMGALLQQEVWSGIHHFFLVPGTLPEIESGIYSHTPPTWTVVRKLLAFLLFSMTGLFGGSCLGAITRRFGALAMTLTSTTRTAATMFISFAVFAHNTCTYEHVVGIVLYILSLLLQGLNKASVKPTS